MIDQAALPSPVGSWKIELDIADRDVARRIAAILTDVLEPPPGALTLFAAAPLAAASGQSAAGWRIEAYYDPMPDARGLIDSLAGIAGIAIRDWRVAQVPDENWVAISQAALPPVTAGRFTVHGSHDRHRVPRGPNALQIDAGEAFGTAHHATTLGCLLAIDSLGRQRRAPASVLDLGCGSGVLALAAARVWPRGHILASDMDRRSVEVARENARTNGLAARVRILRARGLEAPQLRGRRPFDLVVANILAGPLIALAPRMARVVATGGTVVLSGLLVGQSSEVTSAYRTAGFALAKHWRIGGWSTLILERR